ncbi:MAG: hypothetical protein KAJ29_06690 [Alphaproteobacteria bacterium]|nr:hypothetical protein [Alphaproteobacteria bacterium]
MKTIDQKVIGILDKSPECIGAEMAEAHRKFEQAKESGLINPHTFDVPLMSRLSSRYSCKSEKIAVIIP